MKIYDPISWDLPVSWEVPLELFCSKTISGLDLNCIWCQCFPFVIETGYSPTIHICEFMNYQRKFSYCEHLFFPHSAAQLQLGKTWTELLVISEIKIDIVYDFRLWLWAWDHDLRLFIPLRCITLTYLITGSLFKKEFEKNRRKSMIFSDKLNCHFNGLSSKGI